MRPRRLQRTRGEGYVEYAIVLSIIMVCSIVGLLMAGSKTIRQIQTAKGICHGCPDPGPTTDAGLTGGGASSPTTDPVDAPEPAPGSGGNGSSKPEEPPPAPTGPDAPSGGAPGTPIEPPSVIAKLFGWFTGLFA